jgi:hypothetical protein
MQGLRSSRLPLTAVRFAAVCSAAVYFVLCASTPAARADGPASAADEVQVAKRPLAKDPPGMKRLLPDYDVWIDPKNKRVVLDGTICLREGQLEMFACTRGTKEHQSIVSADTRAKAVHAGLLAVGAKVGTPARFEPKYEPATGTEIEITALWKDSQGKVHNDRAQDWIRDTKTGKAMTYPWVFAGSGFWEDEATGQKHYLAESGDFICVSHFPSAMLDLPIASSQANAELMFSAFTDHIPPLGTRVRLVLTPKATK